jgi:hypothetical protein
MKSTKCEKNKVTEIKFPKLMICGDRKLIILATSKGMNGIEGTVVFRDATEPHPLGYYCDTWNSARFKDFLGTVTLSN